MADVAIDPDRTPLLLKETNEESQARENVDVFTNEHFDATGHAAPPPMMIARQGPSRHVPEHVERDTKEAARTLQPSPEGPSVSNQQDGDYETRKRLPGTQGKDEKRPREQKEARVREIADAHMEETGHKKLGK